MLFEIHYVLIFLLSDEGYMKIFNDFHPFKNGFK